MHDVTVLLVALLVTYLPGLALLAALGARRPVLLVGLSPAASVGVAGATAVVVSVTGLRYGPAALALVTGLLAAVAGAGLLPAPPRRGTGTRRVPTRVDRAVVAAGTLLVAGAVAVAGWTWLAGIGPLGTVPQEHDMIIHVTQSAYVERSGRAAPWELAAADVLTGSPVSFYPGGLHLLVAVTSALLGGATVAAINAITVVLLAAVLPCSVAALTLVAARGLRLSGSTAVLGAGFAALVSAGLYRPGFHLMHDGGILANAAALAMTPGVVAALLLLPALRRPAAAAVGVACAGVAWVHPGAAVSVAVTVLAWWLGQALAAPGRRALRGMLPPLLVASATAGVLGAAALSPALGAAGRTSAFPPDSAPASLGEALRSTLGLAYGGYLDPERARTQAVAAVLAAVGVVAVLALRRGYGPVTAWACWVLVTVGAFVSPGAGWEAPITGFFYHALLRTWSHVSLLVPVLAGLGVGVVAATAAVRVRRRGAVPARAAAAVAVVVAYAAYLAWPAAQYAAVERAAVASRYSDPDFVRFDADDQAAIDWLAPRIEPGQRVLNSPNDGSTYLYVQEGVPVVNVYSLGLPGVPYSYRLLESFRSYPADPTVRKTLLDLDVAWVYVDAEAPLIGSRGSPEGWAGDGGFALAPGLLDLDGLPGLQPQFRSGSVTVYSLDPEVLRSLGPRPAEVGPDGRR